MATTSVKMGELRTSLMTEVSAKPFVPITLPIPVLQSTFVQSLLKS